MAADLSELREPTLRPEALEIAEVCDEQTLLTDWRAVLAYGSGWTDEILDAYMSALAVPGFDDDLPWRHYIGRLDGAPVATSTVMCACGVAGLFGMGTISPARRRGIGSAMALEAMRWAAARGYRIGVAVATALGRPVYERIGFRTIGSASLYRLPAEPQA